MKKLLYIILLLNVCNLFAQHQTTLIVSQQQYANEASDLYIWSDAATPTPNEANTVEISVTDGWDEKLNVTLASSIADVYDGTYSILMTALSTSNNYAWLSFTVEIGETYRFTFWAKQGTSSTGWLRGGGGWVANPSNTSFSNTWTEYTFDVEANATTGYFQLWPGRFGAIGDTTYIDNITMIKL